MQNSENKFVSIGKITNFFGIKGEAKVGFDNENQIKKARIVHMLDDESKAELKIKSIRFHKNFLTILLVYQNCCKNQDF